MKQTRKTYDATFKAEVAIEAIIERKTPKMDDAAFEQQKDRYLCKVSNPKQCKILGLSRRAHYYKPKDENKEDLQIMNRIENEIVEHPTKVASLRARNGLTPALNILR